MSKTQSKIIEILKESVGLTAFEIKGEMQKSGVTMSINYLYSTLKKMKIEGKFSRIESVRPFKYYYNPKVIARYYTLI